MVRSLYSGVSGLTTHQTRMDVIGNNIANVNTYGFKASRVTFRDIYYQTARSATSGRNTFAGNNAAQVGYGVQLGTIDKDMSVSSFQNTNYVFDLAIAGDGFFATATFDSINVNSDKVAATVKYTRMGNLGFDSYGNLVTGNNTFVVGSRNTLNGLINNGQRSLESMNKVEILDRNGDGAINAADITFRNVINLTELMQQAYNVYTDDFGYMYGYDWKQIISENPPADIDGNSENSLVKYDLVAYGGTYEQLAAEDISVQMQYLDIQQTILNFNEAVENGVTSTTGEGEGADATVTVNDAASTVLGYRFYVDKTGKEVEPVAGTDDEEEGGGAGGAGGADEEGEGDYLGLYTALYAAQAAYDNAITDEDKEAAYETLVNAKADVNNAGGIVGKLTFGDAEGVSVSAEGIITVTYNSEMKSLARIDLALFDNPNGLVETGLTTFAESVASGEPKWKRAMVDPGVTETSIESNKLEMSNVNLAQEFSDMIVTQRGFQANARIITTSDSMLEELVNLKR